MTAIETRERVLAYFQSWQKPTDWDAFRASLHESVVFDAGPVRVTGADALTAMLRATESPWTDVVLRASMFTVNEAALFYDGTDERTGVRTRVAEHVQLRDGGIVRIIAAICPMPPTPNGAG